MREVRGSIGSTAWAKRGWASVVILVALTACGGGGGGSAPTVPPPTPPTAIPDSLAISAPAAADAASAVQFGNTASALSGLKFNWDFGDGGTSTEAAPSHQYAQGGDFTVVLKVTNDAGTTKEVRTPLSLTNLATVRGLVCSGPNDTGWCWQSPRPTGVTHNDSFFVSAQLGWLVGELGEIFKTVDGGATWKRQSFDANVNWTRVSFADESNGFIVGSGGSGLRTTDGGATWTSFQGSWSQGQITQSPVKLTLVDARTLVVQDDRGGLHVSKDAGATWSASKPNAPVVTRTGTVWSLSVAGDTVLRSTDLGSTNKPILSYVPPAGTRFSRMTLAALDDQRAMISVSLWDEAAAAATYDIWRTRDGGATWARPAMGGFAAAKYSQPALDARTGGFTLNLLSVNTLYRSIDAGDSWTRLDGPPNTFDNRVENYYGLGDGTLVFLTTAGIAVSANDGATWGPVVQPAGSYGPGISAMQVFGQTWQLISGGSSFRSDDKGQSWRASAVSSSSPLHAFHAFDAKRALALGPSCELKESQDGGATWQVRTAPWTSCGQVDGRGEMVWRNSKLGWYNRSDGRLFRTLDGGLSWQDTASGVWVASVQFFDDNNGYALSDGRLLSTKNGGQSWTTVGLLPPESSKIRFFSAKQGVARTFFGLFSTHDGGVTWAKTNALSNGYTDVQFIDANTVWAVQQSGAPSKSTDGGDTWQQVGGLQINALQFLDANRGWAVGWGGQIHATTDGGKTWVKQPINTLRNLEQVFFVDSKTGWVVGEYGTLLATGSGGR